MASRFIHARTSFNNSTAPVTQIRRTRLKVRLNATVAKVAEACLKVRVYHDRENSGPVSTRPISSGRRAHRPGRSKDAGSVAAVTAAVKDLARRPIDGTQRVPCSRRLSVSGCS